MIAEAERYDEDVLNQISFYINTELLSYSSLAVLYILYRYYQG